MACSDPRQETALQTIRAAGSVGDAATVARLEQLEGGWSRHTWALDVDDPDRGRLELIVRVKPPVSLLDTDLVQEHDIYALLAGGPVPVPAVHGLDDAAATPFGGPFFVMDRVAGRSPNVWRRGDRAELEAAWERDGALANDLVATLAAIHALSAEDLGSRVGARSYRDVVTRWRDVQREMELVADPIVAEAYDWALAREPEPVAPALVHGDFRVGNCLVSGGRLAAVLDWELAYLGDPRFDLGYMSLDYHAGSFVEPGSPWLNATAPRDWFAARYAELAGGEADPEAVRTFAVIGGLMLIAILTTGLRAYSERATEDIRMAWSRFALPGLRQDIVRLMGW